MLFLGLCKRYCWCYGTGDKILIAGAMGLGASFLLLVLWDWGQVSYCWCYGTGGKILIAGAMGLRTRFLLLVLWDWGQDSSSAIQLPASHHRDPGFIRRVFNL
jgi:hypothetical protein